MHARRSKAHALWPIAVSVGVLALLLAGVDVHRPAAAGTSLSLDDIYAACAGDNPYFAAAVLPGGVSGRAPVVALHDTADGADTDHPALGGTEALGATFGLAYDWRRGHLYASAYHRRGMPFGPGGPGQVYRIDLGSGTVTPFVRLDAGLDRHDASSPDDAGAADWVGRTGLGDVEIDDAGRNLYVSNLASGRIHRYSVPEGRLLGVFAHGAAAEGWAEHARLFGLAARNGRLYHGVVNAAGEAGATGSFEAVVYRSSADGSSPVRVADLALDYGRSPRWVPWTGLSGLDAETAQPMLVDIEFRENGDMLLGLRDRAVDMHRHTRDGAGDVLGATSAGGTWIVQTSPETVPDDWARHEAAMGGMAGFPGFDATVLGAAAPIGPEGAGAVWVHHASGADIAREVVVRDDGTAPAMAPAVGDLEVLCGPPGSVTATPTTTPSPTPTPTPTPAPAYLPLLLGERCPPLKLDVVLAIDVSTSMTADVGDGRDKLAAAVDAAGAFVDLLDLEAARSAEDAVAVVGFHRRAWIAQPLSGDAAAVRGALAGLSREVDSGTRLDLALRRASESLAAGREDALHVVVLLTDGVPTGVPPAADGSPTTTVLEAARRLHASGAHVFAIGIGEGDVDGALMSRIAGSPNRYVHAPSATDLRAIYEALATDVRCPAGRHDWSRPWP